MKRMKKNTIAPHTQFPTLFPFHVPPSSIGSLSSLTSQHQSFGWSKQNFVRNASTMKTPADETQKVSSMEDFGDDTPLRAQDLVCLYPNEHPCPHSRI
jgi:hypothetical protein